MSQALPYLKSRQKRRTHLTLRYTFDQLVQAPQEQHSREYTWRIGGPPSPTAVSIGTIWMWLGKICTRGTVCLAKPKSPSFSWAPGSRETYNRFSGFRSLGLKWFCRFCISFFNSYDIDDNLCAIFMSWRYFTAWQISFIIKAASFSVKASWGGFSGKRWDQVFTS